MASEEVRGADPVINTKELLLDLRDDLRNFREQDFVEVRDLVKLMASQNLDTRMDSLESFKDRIMGMASIGAILGTVATILSIIAILNGQAPIAP